MSPDNVQNVSDKHAHAPEIFQSDYNKSDVSFPAWGQSKLQDAIQNTAVKFPTDQIDAAQTNPIVRAGTSLLVKISQMQQLVNNHSVVDDLQSAIVDEIKKFEQAASRLGCPHTDIIIARYILCTALDEAITSAIDESHLQKQPTATLLSTFHNETDGGEKVFDLIDQLTRNPVRFLNLIELIYFCLSLGFEGKYRFETRGIVCIENLRDSLYRQIRILRGHVNTRLSLSRHTAPEHNKKEPVRAPFFFITVMVLLTVAVTFGGFSFVLKSQSGEVSETYYTADPASFTEDKR